MKLASNRIIFIFSLLAVLLPLVAFQAPDKILSKQQWSELRKDISFEKVAKKENQENELQEGNGEGNQKMQRSTQPRRSQDSESETVSINLGPLVQIIVIILFIALIVWLLYLLIGNEIIGKSPSKIKGVGDISDFDGDEIPHESDLERWLKAALNDGNYKLVVRIYFLMIIKELENKRLITWENEKTNRDYLNELDGQPYQEDFMAIATNYDRVWYGDKPYSEEVLRSISQDFKVFRDMLNKNSK